MTTLTIDATYENGVLKPAVPLPLKEHEAVRVTVQTSALPTEAFPPPSRDLKPKAGTLGERLEEWIRQIPPEELERLPVDGASQHDHYVYGTPKRPDLS